MEQTSKQNSFHARHMRIELSNWLDLGNTSFKQLQDCNLEIISNVRTLERHCSNLRGSGNDDINCPAQVALFSD